MTIEDELARKIEALRVGKGWSYGRLSEAMEAEQCQIERSSLQKIEKGTPRRRITVTELVAFAKVFDVSITDLLGTDGGAGRVNVEGQARLIDISRQLLEIATSHQAQEKQ